MNAIGSASIISAAMDEVKRSGVLACELHGAAATVIEHQGILEESAPNQNTMWFAAGLQLNAAESPDLRYQSGNCHAGKVDVESRGTSDSRQRSLIDHRKVLLLSQG